MVFFHQTLQYIVFEVFTLCELYPISSLPFLLLLCDVVSSPVFILFYCSIMSPLASSQSLTRKEIDKKMPLNYRSFSSLELHLDFTDPFQKNSEKNEENIYEQQKLHFFLFRTLDICTHHSHRTLGHGYIRSAVSHYFQVTV